MTEEEITSTESIPTDDEKNQRRLALINDQNYGIILCFLEKFRSVLDLPKYSLQRLEDHLVNYQERVSPRLIDFHFILLKRLSLAKNTQREKFDSIITKFASRFDLNDSDHLTTTGYLQAGINVKIRILKNLLESQFDLNQTFTKTLIDKSAREIKSTPLGRDRFGVSYWLFMDTDCFVRLFREDVDVDRTWNNVAKDRDEFEKIIKLLITDSVVRKKFTDWIIDYEPFSSLLPSNEFEECYLPPVDIKIEQEEQEMKPTKKKRGRRPKNSIELEVKQEDDPSSTDDDDEKPDIPIKRKRGRPKTSIVPIKQEEEEEGEEIPTATDDDDEEEKFQEPIKKKRGRPKASIVPIKQEEEEIHTATDDDEKFQEPTKKKRGRPKSSTLPLKKESEIKQEDETIDPMSNDDEKIQEPMKKKRGRPKGSIKIFKNDIEMKSENESITNHHELNSRKSGRVKTPIKQIDTEELTPNEDENNDISIKKRTGRSRNSIKSSSEEIIPSHRGRKRKTIIEYNHTDDNDKQNDESFVRRSSRPRKAPTIDSPSETPTIKKKRSMNNGKSKLSHDLDTTTNNNNNNNNNTKSGRSRRRRKTTSRRNFDDEFCLSSSGSDEHINYHSEDDYDSDEHLPDPNDENFFALDDDIHPNGEELRTAKTAQASTIITACNICSKSDRPEVLLLCDDCDDAYHLECLRPILLSVPDGDWFCPLCEHKKLANNLIEKLKELLINYNLIEKKRVEYDLKKSNIHRKLKIKEYTSDESITASESEHENIENNLHQDDSMLSLSQTNENSNISSSYYDDSNKNISQRGRHRRTRFDMNKMLNDDNESDEHSNTDNDDDEYIENTTQITNFDVQIPKKMTRLLNQRYRPIIRNDQRLKPKPIASRLCHTSSMDLNEKLGSPIIYINGENNSHQIKSVITNSNQTLKIVRRWNDVQRRNKLRTNNMKLLNETTSDCADENSVFCPDDTSPPRSNDSNSNHDIKDEDSTIIRSKITLVQPTNLLPMYKNSTRNLVKKNEVNFDRLTRDIQYAVSEANTLSTIPKAIDQQQQIKRIQKTNFSPYLTKVALRPLPVLLPKPAGVGYKIFKSKDPPNSTTSTATTNTTDLSNIILTPSSSSSLLDGNDEQTTSTIPT